MGQVMTLCASDEADEHGYDKNTVEKVREGQSPRPEREYRLRREGGERTLCLRGPD